MKTFIIIGLSCIGFLYNILNANERGWIRFPVSQMEETELQGVFKLYSNDPSTLIHLDCLSFIHGLNFYDKSDEELIYSLPLSEYECREIYGFLKNSLSTNLPACVEVDLVNRSYVLSRKEESCLLDL